MKKLLILILLLVSITGFSQKKLYNSNNELCIELYQIHDPLKMYRVVMVIDYLNSSDSAALQKWDQFSEDEKMYITQLWTMTGYRIEIIDYPVQYLKKEE